MWEVVKTVKGYDITRMVGSRGAYHVSEYVSLGAHVDGVP